MWRKIKLCFCKKTIIEKSKYRRFLGGGGKTPSLLRCNHVLLNLISFSLVFLIFFTFVNPVQIYASGETEEWSFSYKGSVEEWTVPKTGKYFISIYGASGGGASASTHGFGGYTDGYINLMQGEKLYISVGQSGAINGSATFGGGGKGGTNSGSGGGCTYVSLSNQKALKEFFGSHKEDLLLVAGGGGGVSSGKQQNANANVAGSGGGLYGSVCDETPWTNHYSYSNWAFGLGQDAQNSNTESGHTGYSGAGGGGYYGGSAGQCGNVGGAGGSGYVNQDKVYDHNYITGGNAHIGNGSCYIRYEGEVSPKLILDLCGEGTIDGEAGPITVVRDWGTIYQLPIPVSNDGKTFIGWEVVSGDIDSVDTTYTFGVTDTYLRAIFSSSLELTTVVDNTLYNKKGGINLSFIENDTVNKVYVAYQSTDGQNWYPVFSNKDIANGDVVKADYKYVGRYQTYSAPVFGLYKLEVGGQCSYRNAHRGWEPWEATGGYSKGYSYLDKDQTLYIAVGGINKSTAGGWNGGGNGDKVSNGYGGAGATSIQSNLRGDGQLKCYADYKDEVLLVAGGAGGWGVFGSTGQGGGSSSGYGSVYSGGRIGNATQTSGYAFGQGQSANVNRRPGGSRGGYQAGGGGGWYGGFAYNGSGGANSSAGAGGGSGYVGGVLNGVSITGGNDTGRIGFSYGPGVGGFLDSWARVTLELEYLTDTVCNNVGANDLEAPSEPSNAKIVDVKDNGNICTISWDSSTDAGSEYYHKVCSYLLSSPDVLVAESNHTKDEIVSGLKGYYYVVDNFQNTTVTSSASFTETNSIDMVRNCDYLHIAAVDNAGNISTTYTYTIPHSAIYTVVHKQENLSQEYVTKEKEVFLETVDAEVTPATKSYEGFTSPQLQTVSVKSDNSTTVTYLYSRNVYEVEYILNGGSCGFSHPDKIKYGEVATISNPVREGFTFQGWTITDMDSATHYIGSETTTLKSVSGAKATSFKNLRVDNGKVTFEALWKDTSKPTLKIEYKDADGVAYATNKWTNKTVYAIATAEDTGSGVDGIRWDDEPYRSENPSTKTFSVSGSYQGTVYAKDNADKEQQDFVPSQANVVSVKYGPVLIDKLPPNASVSYKVNNEWKDEATEYTNTNVVVKIVATDKHSGLHANAYSWDDGQTWSSRNTKEFAENAKGFVLVRDLVGNTTNVAYSVSGIDKKVPTVIPDNPPDPDLPDPPDSGETNYEFEEIGKLAYDWVNSDVLLSFKAEDRASTNPNYASSGIKQMVLYSADEGFNKASICKSSSSSSLAYITKTQGITYYVLEVEDNSKNKTIVNITVKIDKTAPVIPAYGDSQYLSNFEIENIDLNKYGIDEVEEKIKQTTSMKRSFKFDGTDYNSAVNGTMTKDSDSSGIASFTLRLIDADDASVYKDYELGYILAGSKNTDEFASETSTKAILSASFAQEIDTFADFPMSSALKYSLTLTDRAGNKTVYKNANGNEIKNFSIKAVIHYAGLIDKNFENSNENETFNFFDLDANGKQTVVPYFETGDFGYVEIWTIGYVPQVEFDFEGMGEEAVLEIQSGKMPSLYNMGVTTNIGFVRTIPVTQGEKINTSYPDVNGIPYAAHYGLREKELVDLGNQKEFLKRFGSNGTSIRIPVYYSLVSDGTKRDDGSNNYHWEIHKAKISAVKSGGSYKESSYPIYVIWDKKQVGIHYRITHES